MFDETPNGIVPYRGHETSEPRAVVCVSINGGIGRTIFSRLKQSNWAMQVMRIITEEACESSVLQFDELRTGRNGPQAYTHARKVCAWVARHDYFLSNRVIGPWFTRRETWASSAINSMINECLLLERRGEVAWVDRPRVKEMREAIRARVSLLGEPPLDPGSEWIYCDPRVRFR